VAWRATHGPFRSLAGLDSVPGIGPALLAGIAPHLTLPAAPAVAKSVRSHSTIDLNTATAAELDALPGIGPALAERVVAYRAEHGRFRTVDELARVPGIGPSLVSRVRGQARATP
jgi:competence protein ComEA